MGIRKGFKRAWRFIHPQWQAMSESEIKQLDRQVSDAMKKGSFNQHRASPDDATRLGHAPPPPPAPPTGDRLWTMSSHPHHHHHQRPLTSRPPTANDAHHHHPQRLWTMGSHPPPPPPLPMMMMTTATPPPDGSGRHWTMSTPSRARSPNSTLSSYGHDSGYAEQPQPQPQQALSRPMSPGYALASARQQSVYSSSGAAGGAGYAPQQTVYEDWEDQQPSSHENYYYYPRKQHAQQQLHYVTAAAAAQDGGFYYYEDGNAGGGGDEGAPAYDPGYDEPRNIDDGYYDAHGPYLLQHHHLHPGQVASEREEEDHVH